MKRTALIATIAGALLLSVVTPAFASHIQDVLGEQTAPNEIVVPPVVAGAGMILPDSPFYFVDNAFQNFKLSLALSPEKKAEARNLIIGERLAELRIMAERNNTAAVNETLNDIAVQSEKMAAELADAAAQGRNVSSTAQNINNTLREHRNVLGLASEHANGPLALQLKSVNQSLLAAKVSIEEHMPEQQMLEAMQEDLEDEVDTQVLGIETSTSNLEKRLAQLDQLTARAEKSGVDPELLTQIKQKRLELQAQLKSNARSTKDAVRQLKETRKAAKNARKSPPRSVQLKRSQNVKRPQSTLTPSPTTGQ